MLGLFIDRTGLEEWEINEANIEKLTAIVEYVSKNIKKFTGEKDIDILRLIKNRCDDKGLTVEKIKMHRATGMHYFYRNNIMIAMDKLNLAINKAEEIGRKDLVAACTSDLGLIYFYEHKHEKAKMQYKCAEGLMQGTPDLDKYILHCHYYRYGILHRTLHEYELAENAFKKALSYAEEKVEIGLTLVNIGINYKVQMNFNKALEYYEKAMDALDESDYFNKSRVYNNLAELYKVAGSYDKALEHINRAFEYLDNKDASELFINFTTYTEIAVLLREPEKALDKFLEMLLKIEDYSVNKSLIIEGIDSLATLGAENREMLKKLESAVVMLIKFTSAENREYKKELERCLRNIRLYIQDINNSDVKGGLLFEENNN